MEYILSAKKNLITDQACPLLKNLNSITAETLSIEDNILFSDNL